MKIGKKELIKRSMELYHLLQHYIYNGLDEKIGYDFVPEICVTLRSYYCYSNKSILDRVLSEYNIGIKIYEHTNPVVKKLRKIEKELKLKNKSIFNGENSLICLQDLCWFDKNNKNYGMIDIHKQLDKPVLWFGYKFLYRDLIIKIANKLGAHLDNEIDDEIIEIRNKKIKYNFVINTFPLL